MNRMRTIPRSFYFAGIVTARVVAFLIALHLSASVAAGEELVTVRCESSGGARQDCPADTSGGVALARSYGKAACLLGKSWGYDNRGVWVSEGCDAEFLVRSAAPAAAAEEVAAESEEAEEAEVKPSSPEYVPNAGFKLYEGANGQIYMRLMAYVRYLNQEGLDPTYTDSFGNTKSVQIREDVQINKFFLPFSGWFVTPSFRYYLYVWSSNPNQGDPAQVVGAGNLTYIFNRHISVGGGITSLPSVRSTEGQFPYWLTVDNRLIADEFFRGSYTSGVWVKGEITTTLKYQAMLGNNLSTLGVSASQLDNGFNTTALMLQWLPTTGEFGLWGEFGDLDYHEQVATRLGAHYTHSREDRQTQPGTNAIENSQIRLTDGSIIFTPDLFGPGISVDEVTYDMAAVDGGIKYRGLSLEAEYYRRTLSEFTGANVAGIEEITDDGYQVQASMVAIRDTLQIYAGGSWIRGDFGDGSDLRAGLNWYPFQKRGVRVNAEWIELQDCPVGYPAVPYVVGGNGGIFHLDVEMNW